MPQNPSVAEYVVARIAALGIDKVFGVPGDYAFPWNDAIEASGNVEWVGAANELNAAYAADGYARARGAAMLCTTFGPGELSAINGVMGALAESVPIFWLVGLPSSQLRREGRILHHMLRDGDYRLNSEICRRATIASTELTPENAIADAGLLPSQVSQPRTGVIAGSGGGSPQWQVETADLLRQKGVRKVGPYMVPRTMCSTVSAALATVFAIKGVSYSLSAACATSAHCIGAAADMIRHGVQDIMFAGGGEEAHWSMTCQFDAKGAVSSQFYASPDSASRP